MTLSYEVDDDIYPASAVAYIVSRWGSTSTFGSGFLVGKNDVLTAAHVIYNGALGGLADEIRIYPSYDPDDWNNRYFQPVWVEYYSDFDPNSDGFIRIGDFYRPTFAGSEIDIALLSLDTDIGSSYGYFGIDPNFSGGSVGVLGYPGVYGRQPTYDSGTVGRSRVDNVYLIDSDLEVNPGNSGGPIYYDYGSGPYAVGIVSSRLAAASLASHSSWLMDSIEQNDRFLTGYLPPPAYSLSAQSGFVNEGESALFTLTTTNVAAFTALTYRITGVQPEDIQDARLGGTALVGQDGRAVIAIPIRKDFLAEGDETLRITIETATAAIVIKDTSKTINYLNGNRYVGDVLDGQFHGEGTYTFANGSRYVGEFRNGTYHGKGTYTFANGVIWSGVWRDNDLMPSVYTLRALSTPVDEGQTAQFDLGVTNFKSNTVLPYTITGLQTADIVRGELAGSVTVGSNGRATILVAIASDNRTEGPETMTVTVRSLQGATVASASVTINDTSVSPVVAVNGIEGTEAGDLLRGTPGRDQINARGGDDAIVGSAGSDYVDGGSGIDVVRYNFPSTGISLSKSDSGEVLVSGGSDTDTLVNVERLQFTDQWIAIDLNGNAGVAGRMVVAAFGRQSLKEFAGIGISLVDRGWTSAQLAELIISANLVPSDNSELVQKIYENVVGQPPNELESAFFVQMLEKGIYTQSGLLELAANSNFAGVALEQSAIGLVGLPYHPSLV